MRAPPLYTFVQGFGEIQPKQVLPGSHSSALHNETYARDAPTLVVVIFDRFQSFLHDEQSL